MKPAALFWSGGKDSALSLYQVLASGEYAVRYLITTLNAEFSRISMHGVQEKLLDLQAKAIGIPLKKMWVRKGTNEEYEERLGEVFTELKNEGIFHIIYGDIFLEDIRSYREKLLQHHLLNGVFPLWNKNSDELMQLFLQSDMKALTCCVNSANLNESWAGREINSAFFNELPEGLDPFGENGEFHSFVFDASFYQWRINFTVGEKIFRPLEIKKAETEVPALQGFWFVDLIPH